MQSFLKHYIQGNPLKGGEELLSSPFIQYDSLQGKGALDRLVFNYIDALFFKQIQDLIHANRSLTLYLQENPHACQENTPILNQLEFDLVMHRVFYTWESFFVDCNENEDLMFLNEYYSEELTPREFDRLKKACRGDYLEVIKKWFLYQKNCAAWIRKFPDLIQYWAQKKPPYYPISYPYQWALPDVVLTNKTPMVFLESYQIDWTQFLESLGEQKILFVFFSESSFFQCLQFNPLLQFLFQERVQLLVLRGDVKEQIESQGLLSDGSKYAPVYLSKDSPYRDLEEQLVGVFNRGRMPDEIYLEEVYSRQLRYKYGQSRFFATQTTLINDLSFHKKNAVSSCEMRLNQRAEEDLSHMISLFPKQKKPPLKKVERIVHFVPHIIDHHENSQVLLNFLSFAKKLGIKEKVICSDRLVLRAYEYPIGELCSSPSSERGSWVIESIQQEGIPVVIDTSKTYLETIETILREIKEFDADVVVFHCYDIMVRLIVQLVDISLTVFYEYEGIPYYPGFNVIFASSSKTTHSFKEYFSKMGTCIKGIPKEMELEQQIEWCYQQIKY